MDGITSKSVDSLQISKVTPQQGPPKKKSRVTEGILPNVYCPVEKPMLPDFAQPLAVNLKSIGSNAQINFLFYSFKTKNCRY